MEQSKIKSPLFFKNQDHEWKPVEKGISRQITGYDVNIMMVKVKFDKGAIGTIHQHHHSQTTYIESGSFEVTIADKKQVLITGDSFFVPPNIPHGAVCVASGVLIDVFSPIREDFLDF